MQILESEDRRNGKKEWQPEFHDFFVLRQFAIYEIDLMFEIIIAKCLGLKESKHKLTAISIRNNPRQRCPTGVIGLWSTRRSRRPGHRPGPSTC